MGYLKASLKANIRLSFKPFISLLLVAAVALGAAAALSGAVLNAQQQKAFSPLEIAVAVDEQAGLFSNIFEIVASTDEIQAYASINLTNEEEALRLIENNKAAGALIFPEDVMQSIAYGHDFVIKLYINAARPLEAALIGFVAQSALDIFATAQHGVFAGLDYYYTHEDDAKQNGEIKKLQSFIFDINVAYVTWFLNRGQIYREQALTEAEGLSKIIFANKNLAYILSWILFFVFLSPPVLYPLLSMQDKGPWLARLKSTKNSLALYGFCQIAAACLPVFLFMCAVLFPAALWLGLFSFSFKNMLILLLGAFCFCCFAWLLANLGSIVACAVLSLLCALAMLFFSGALINPLLLPFSLKNFGRFNPMLIFAKAFSPLFGANAVFANLGGLILLTVLCLTICLLVCVRRQRRRA